MENEITHVSDTALMVAACRAMETEHVDALVRDPFARRLAGERGYAFAQSLPAIEILRFAVSVRAHFIDELLLKVLREEKIQTVANLGAGLDTRPWRLDLPSDLLWVEADYTAMLEYKIGKLATEKPNSRLEQVPTDLAKSEDRRALYRRIGKNPALMITEGLLMYLTREQFQALATEPVKHSGIRYWILDIASEAMMGISGPAIARLRSKDHLAGQAILDAAGEEGWRITANYTYAKDGVAAAPERVQKIIQLLMEKNPGFHPPPDEVAGFYLLRQGG